MSRRSRAREIVLQVLYQVDLNPDQSDEVGLRFIHARLNYDRELVKFAETLIAGVRNRRAELDEILQGAAQNWKLSRMPATDRNVLRLGAFEILFFDTPGRVAINEAIELAKRYGTQNSAQFVNGILDRLLNDRAKQPNDGHRKSTDAVTRTSSTSAKSSADSMESANNPQSVTRPQVVIIDDSSPPSSKSAE